MRHHPLLAAFCVMVASCGSQEQPAPPQPIPVETVTVTTEAVPNVVELPGRIEPVRAAEVRARVTGIVQARLFQEGTNVAEGQPLFRIDPAELRASRAQKAASLERAQATAANASAVVVRYRSLVAEAAISRQEYDAAIAAMREANANVAQIRAELQSADLQLSYTTVRAPISGRVGRAGVTEGALVSQAEGTLLTRIEQMSPVYVSFAQSASEILKLRQAIESGEIVLPQGEAVEVRLQYADGTEYPIPGVIDFLAQSVDPETGTVALRAEFANPEGLLLPGEFVRAKVVAGRIANGITVPQKAVTVGANGGSVYVVDGEGRATVKQVVLGALMNGQWIIEDGLAPGDVVITSNLQKIRPGAPVRSTTAAKPKPAARPAQQGR
jgi:membrane fusion protein (multidrug efflux system)